MPQGYSIRTAKLIEEGDPDNLGVQLGKYCLENDISAVDVAAALGVTKVTIYHWFAGGRIRHDTHTEAVRRYLGLEAAVE